MRNSLFVLAFMLLSASPAVAATCKSNFSVQGLPLLSTVEYRTWDHVSGVTVAKALANIAASLRADGYYGVKINKAKGTVTARQEASGSGREQSLRFVARKAGKALQIDAVFTVQQGQLSPKRIVRNELCKLIGRAKG